MHIVLIGNTGSGKTTLGKALAEALGLPLISSGSIARELSDTDPSTRLALEQGAMAPEQPMRVAIRQRIERADIENGGWILDGFPRTAAQLMCLLQWSAAMPTFVLLETDEWTCVERLIQRKRAHDHPDAIAKRLDSYRTTTSRMIEILDSGRVTLRIDGGWPTEDQVSHIKSRFQ